MPGLLIGKRSADNARRFMVDIASRLVFPNAHASDAHSYMAGGYKPITQISTDCFNAYPEAVDLAFGPYVKFGTIRKEYRNAKMIYTPSEMVGTQRRRVTGIAFSMTRAFVYEISLLGTRANVRSWSPSAARSPGLYSCAKPHLTSSYSRLA